MTVRDEIIMAVIGILVLLLASAATWVWISIPPDLDPAALPSSVLVPPPAAYRGPVEQGRSAARSLAAEEKLPGLSVAVAVDGEIVWAEAFGWADLEKKTPMTPAALFRIGGVSQTLTAAAAGLLFERGRLDPDAPVQRYVPGFPAKPWPITTRQLMSHTAGLGDPDAVDGILRHANCSDDASRLRIFADKPLRFRPGTKYSYSGFGWALAGAVVAAAANEPYIDFVRREVLTRLGMFSTVPDIAGKSEPAGAKFYFPSLMLNPRYGLQDAPVVNLSCILPAGGFLSTPADLVRFGSAMVGGGFLDPATVKELLTPVRLASGESTGQALGWVVRHDAMGADRTPVRIAGQGLGPAARRGPIGASLAGGQASGGTASFMILPEHRIAIAVATNVSGAENPSRLANRLADLFIRAER